MEQTNRYDYVDLDLPSGTLWATCNVGANNPWEYGKYFQWGDTEGYYGHEQYDFSWSTYKWCNGTYNTLTKYNNNSRFGENPDNKLVLDPKDDAAHVHMGGDWRMPSQDEMQELVDNTDNKWVTNYQGTGVKGRLYFSKKDASKSIFIPASSSRLNFDVISQGITTNLWSSTLYSDRPYGACEFDVESGHCYIINYDRRCGLCVRGVKEKKGE